MVQARTFLFVREIASGGFGSVYLAETPRPDGSMRQVALKLLHEKWSENEEIASRMRDEARLLARVRHPNIVEVLDLTRIRGRSAIVMEYLEAVDLNDVTTWAADNQQRVPLKVALEMAANVASALEVAFNFAAPGQAALRVIHRDIKPSNIMINGTGLVKVLDFGTARAEFDARESKTQEMAFGSLEYMPPERLFFEPETSNSDIYSLAATLYELLALEKLGKARLRPADHDKFIRERFDDLLLRYPMPTEEVEDVLHELMLDMLAFDEADRPTAANVASRMTSFIGTLSGRSLAPWAAEVIPPLFRKSLRQAAESPDSLVGLTLSEDAVAPGFGAQRSSPIAAAVFEDPPKELPAAFTPEPPSPSEDWDGGETVRVALGSGGEMVHAETEWVIDDPPEEPASGGGRWLIAVVAGVAALVLVLGLAGVGLVGLGGVAAWMFTSVPGTELAAAPVPQGAAPAPIAAPVEAPTPAPPEGPGARFVSALPNMRKISVRCTQGAGEGQSEAWVAGDSPGDCTVTAIDRERNRFGAVVKGTEPRTYTCFEAGSETCQ